MKIGILTFHKAANYGAVLQAYALQRYLMLQGHDVEIVDYQCLPIEQMHSPNYFLHCKGFKNKLKQLIRRPIKTKKRKLFDDFIERKLELSAERCIKKEDIKKELCNKYNIVITGSDQVWNPILTLCDTTYLLDFADKEVRKVSYAASIGLNDLSEEYVTLYKKCLSEFYKISVREKQAKRILLEKMELKSAEVLDPTLLLNADEWKCFLKEPEQRNYVLLYMIKQNHYLIEYADLLAKEKELTVIFISDTMIKRRGIVYIPYATPEEWVGLFLNASYVITNSFHGTAFSLNFNKKIVIGLSKDKKNGNSRITDLLNELEVTYENDDGIIDLTDIVEWEPVNTKMNELRVRSCQFLNM